MAEPPAVQWGTPKARWILFATVLGSGIAFLDTTVVNVALATIGAELDASVAVLQWILNAYTLTLASLILIGGSLGDLFGRRRVFLIGVTWFAIGSAICGVAPNAGTLVAARAFQGIGGALLTPGSLAIIQSTFARGARGAAVGAGRGCPASPRPSARSLAAGSWTADRGA
jgi:MFS family permease